jgi:YesN/AraC family two-component response regulator
MDPSSIHIKNMVCDRCISTVKSDLEHFNISYSSIRLGTVELQKELSAEEKHDLSELLKSQGFELLESKNSRIIEAIKNIVRKYVHEPAYRKNITMSTIISEELNHEYSSLSALFSSVEGITIEKYLIAQKIEKAKELLVYDELSLQEIAYKLGYSSSQYLSSQFKKITGLTPSDYKNLGVHSRTTIDKLG